MTTMNRLYAIYKEVRKSAHPDKYVMGMNFMYASLDKHRRGNCVLASYRQ